MTAPRAALLAASLLAASALAALAAPPAHAEVTAEAEAYGTTVLVSFANGADEPATSIRVWVGEGSEFASAKAGGGWSAAVSPGNLAVFSSGEGLAPGGTARFGLVTDGEVPAIYWRAEGAGGDLGKGEIRPGAGSGGAQDGGDPGDAQDGGDPPAADPGPAITDESVFRIVPGKPNVGATVRVVGEGLGGLRSFDFYIGPQKAGAFRSGEDGSFVGTARIPAGQDPGRVDFRLSSAGEQKEFSAVVEEPAARDPPEEPGLTIDGAPQVAHPGDGVGISGTGAPGGAVTARITAPDGSVSNSMVAEIGPDGRWDVGGPVAIPADAQAGTYVATVTDGRETVTARWTVESNQVLELSPVELRTNPGMALAFEGTAPPGSRVEASLEDPAGRELSSDVALADGSGSVYLEFPTSRTTEEGTYTLVATLGAERDFVHAGLGVLPSTPVNLELDAFHYGPGGTAEIELSGGESDTLELLVVDLNDKQVLSESVALGPTGRGSYSLALDGYKNTVYTAIAKKGSVQSEEKFAVNLKEGPSNLNVQTTKEEYLPGEQILITGDTMESRRTSDAPDAGFAYVCPGGASVYLVTFTLVDQDGEDVREKGLFANNKCRASDSTFRIPAHAEPGTWSVRADSGPRSATAEFEVRGLGDEEFRIELEDGGTVSGQPSVGIHVAGARQTVTIVVTDGDGSEAVRLHAQTSDDGRVDQLWVVPRDAEPGTYTFNATYNNRDFAAATYEVGGGG